MANVQHATLTDPNLHEPKGVAAATVSEVYVADGAGSGEWTKLTDADMDFSDKTKNVYGWNDIADSAYTSGAPRSISSGTRTKITNNAGAAQTDTSRLGTIWNTTLNTFQIDDLNAVYLLRINMKVKAAAGAGTPYTLDIELESANGPTIISANTQYVKGGGHTNLISWTAPLYMGSYINDYDLSMYVTSDTAITLYDIGFVIVRSYKES